MDFGKMTEADTRAELIDPALFSAGWKTDTDIKVKREYPISISNILNKNPLYKKLTADYVLSYRNRNLAVIEAKRSAKSYTEGVAQAKQYAELLRVRFAYATNGHKIYQIDLKEGREEEVSAYPSPETLWKMTFAKDNSLFNLLSSIPLKTDGRFKARYYQENAVNAFVEALSEGKKRILLTLATGTGKTCIAFQIAWKLMQTRWNIVKVGERLPRILFLADRNILADQAFNSFKAFPEDAMTRITPENVRKNGRVPDAQNIFFTIFQTFMSGEKPYFGQYPKDFFDFIIVDECHRGGADEKGNWHYILDYFDSAVQLGMTATPKRKDNVDTYRYFGNPVYEYSLKQAISDGFLTPFRVRSVSTNYGTYKYEEGDIVNGEIDIDKTYKEPDFNRNIELKEKERLRVKDFMRIIPSSHKTLVFCATQNHAGIVRDLINQEKKNTDIDYCVRVTADDGEVGEQFLRYFQDTEKCIPTILTTSEKLTTGVDAIQVRHIVLLRPVNSMTEFKQIIGRGTRLCEGKDYFTIHDYVNASERFADPEWDGPINYVGKEHRKYSHSKGGSKTKLPVEIVLGENRKDVSLNDNGTSFYDPESGKVLTAEKFIEKLAGTLPYFFKSEEELRRIWSDPLTRQELLKKLKGRGYGEKEFSEVAKEFSAEDNDVFDILIYVAYKTNMLSRKNRADMCRRYVMDNYESRQREFINFVLEQYENNGVKELNADRLGDLIKLKYGTPQDAKIKLAPIDKIRSLFLAFQKYLYREVA